MSRGFGLGSILFFTVHYFENHSDYKINIHELFVKALSLDCLTGDIDSNWL